MPPFFFLKQPDCINSFLAHDTPFFLLFLSAQRWAVVALFTLSSSPYELVLKVTITKEEW